MKPLTMNEHLAIARDHGISIPTFHYGPGGGDDDSSIVHYTACSHLAGTAPTAVEDLPVPAWGLASCNDCWSLDNATSGNVKRVTELLAISQVTQAATDYVVTAQVATVPGAIEALNRDELDDFMEDYANTCYQLRPRTALDGLSYLQHRWTSVPPNDPWGTSDPTAAHSPLLDHVADLAEDLTRRWQVVLARTPYRTHLQRDQPAGSPQLRMARRTPPDWNLDPSITRPEAIEAVLLAEAPRLTTHGDWEVVAWDRSLHRWTPPGSAADTHGPGGTPWTTREIEHALTICANNGDPDRFADVLTAVRAAHAA